MRRCGKHNMVRVFATTNRAEAEIIRGALKTVGIAAVIEDKSIAGQTGSPIDQVHIAVDEQHAEQAKLIIKEATGK